MCACVCACVCAFVCTVYIFICMYLWACSHHLVGVGIALIGEHSRWKFLLWEGREEGRSIMTEYF